jgi:hypothetical protein
MIVYLPSGVSVNFTVVSLSFGKNGSSGEAKEMAQILLVFKVRRFGIGSAVWRIPGIFSFHGYCRAG